MPWPTSKFRSRRSAAGRNRSRRCASHDIYPSAAARRLRIEPLENRLVLSDTGWATGFGGPGMFDHTHSVAVDAAGSAYVTGYFEETAQFGGTTLTSAGSNDIFVTKLDSSGSVLWATRFGGTGVDRGYGIAVDAAGTAYVTGHFQETAQFGGTTLTSAGSADIFVTKLDISGNVLWATRFGGTGLDFGYGIAVDAAGTAYVTGFFRATAQFGGTTLTSAGGSADIFVTKLDISGNVLWATRFGGTGADYGNGIAVDAAGTAYVTGYFRETAQFGGTTLTSAGSNDIFVTKLNSSGNVLWATGVSGTGYDQGRGIAVDATGSAYVTGYFEETAQFGGTTLTSAGGSDIFVTKLNSSGSVLWATRFGGTEVDRGYGIAVDAAGTAYVTGGFDHRVDFDPGPGTAYFGNRNGSDAFVLKLDRSGDYVAAWQMGGGETDYGCGIAADVQGRIYATGDFSGTALSPYGSTLTSAGGRDIFVLQLPPENSPPMAKLDLYTAVQDNLLDVAAPGVLGNDRDIAGDPFTAEAVDRPDHGSLTLRADGSFSYRPAAGFLGRDRFTYRAFDGLGYSNVAAVTINVVPPGGWVVGAGGPSTDRAKDIATDDAGNTYVAGYFEGTADFDPGPGTAYLTSVGSRDGYLAKYLSDGRLGWVTRFGGPGRSSFGDYAYSVAVDAAGTAYVTGYFEETAQFGGTTLTSDGHSDIFVTKLNSSGDVLWATRLGGTGYDYGYGIAVDAAGNAYVTGTFTTYIHGHSIDAIFVSKLNSSGNVLWAREMGGTNYARNRGYGIAVDAVGSAYVTGYFEETAQFGGTTFTSAGGDDIFVTKLNSSGDVLWATRFGGTGGDYGNGIAVDAAGTAYVTGYFEETVQFGGTTLTSAGGSDIVVTKLNSNGSVLWARQVGGSGADLGDDIALDSNGNAYVTGTFYDTVDFDPGPGIASLTSEGSYDAFLLKLSAGGDYGDTWQMGGLGGELGYGVDVDTAGNVYAAGDFSMAAIFPTGVLTAVADLDVYVLKLIPVEPSPRVVRRHVFYNNSAFDRSGGGGEGVSGDGVPDLIITSQGLVIDTDGETIIGYSLESAAGIFTGEMPNNLGTGSVDTDYLIHAVGFTLNGTHWLGTVIGPEFSDTNLFQDLTFTYTTDRWYDGTLIWPAARDGAIAPDKTALMPGQTATFANYTSYSGGINGIMIDVANLMGGTTGNFSIDDFQFRVGNSDDPGTWGVAPQPTSVTLRPGDGVEGSHRVTLIWPDNAIEKQWLQVTVLANVDTGLIESDVFYFGNAVGETGNSATEAKVTVVDMLGARDNQRSFLDPAPIDFPFDFDRDAQVKAVDMLIARNNQTHFLNALKLITVPGPKAAKVDAGKAEHEPAHDVVLRQAAQQETPLAKLNWLYEFEESATRDQPSDKHNRSNEPEEALLASF